MKKLTWVSRTLVLSPYHIGLCRDEAAFKRELRKLKVPEKTWDPWIGNGAHATVHFFQQGKKFVAIVCMDPVRGEPRSYYDTLLVHESVHIWQLIKRAIGEPNPSDEFDAYAIQNISRNLIDAYHGK